MFPRIILSIASVSQIRYQFLRVFYLQAGLFICLSYHRTLCIACIMVKICVMVFHITAFLTNFLNYSIGEIFDSVIFLFLMLIKYFTL